MGDAGGIFLYLWHFEVMHPKITVWSYFCYFNSLQSVSVLLLDMGYCNSCISSVIFMLCSNWPLCCFRCFCPLTSHAIYTAANGCFRYCPSKYENLFVYIYIGINQVPPQCKSSLHDKQNYSANTQLQFPGIINVVTRSVHQVNKSAVFSVLRRHPKS